MLKNMLPSTQENKVKLFSPKFYALCGIGGILSCGTTHTLVTPVDLVKCRMQTGFPYKNTFNGFSQIIKEEGFRGITRGWGPTFVGYSFQGLCKFGFYEYFKKLYTDVAGYETAEKWRTFIYMGASASAEFFADIALCPWEAVKVRVQTDPSFARGLTDGLPRILKTEGMNGLFKGLVPLWLRQIPYTIMKFTAFEAIVEAIYKHFLSKPKEQYNKAEQLGVSFIGGYIAGVFCAIVSHPADVVVSKLNKAKGTSIGEICRKLGFKGMWEGLLPRIFMIGTLTALQWFIYDSFKVAVGLPTSGGIAKEEKEE
jgi:solute carrier family 25 phosphate transporter 3